MTWSLEKVQIKPCVYSLYQLQYGPSKAATPLHGYKQKLMHRCIGKPNLLGLFEIESSPSHVSGPIIMLPLLGMT